MTRPKYNQPTNQYSEGQSINQLTDESNQWKKNKLPAKQPSQTVNQDFSQLIY